MPVIIDELVADVTPPPSVAPGSAAPAETRRAADITRDAVRHELTRLARRRERLQAD